MKKIVLGFVLITLVLGMFGFVGAEGIFTDEGPSDPNYVDPYGDGDGTLTQTTTRHVYQCTLRNRFSHYMSIQGETVPDSFMYKENSYVYKCYLIDNN